MDIQQLRYFNTVVHLENVSKAAESLHISQSALSKQIRHLENELGVPLFTRKGKKIVLNKAGMRFYNSSEQILRELQSATDDIHLLISGKTPRIRIGSSSMPGEMLECIGSFSDQYPETVFALNSRVDFEETVDINQYDTLICPEEFRFENLNGFHLYNESYYFAVGSSSPLADEVVFSFSMLSRLPLVFLHGDNQIPEYPYRICSTVVYEPAAIVFTDSVQSHRWMIASGRACGFVSVSEADSYAQDPGIRLLKILDPRFIRPMKICFLRENHLSELGLKFRDHVITYFHLEDKGASHDISG